MAKNDSDSGIKVLADNRKARFNYTVEEKFESGIELRGTEVKSIRIGKFSFADSYARVIDNELILCSFHISPYEFGNIFNHDPDRNRRRIRSQTPRTAQEKDDARQGNCSRHRPGQCQGR